MNKKATFYTIAAVGAAVLIGNAIVGPVKAQDLPTLKVCTGGKDGKYFQTASALRAQVKPSLNVEVIPTDGSLANLRKLSMGECDAAIVQSDAWGVFTSLNPAIKLDIEQVVPLYQEFAQLVCNRKSGIEHVYDLPGRKDTTVLIGSDLSGTAVTWQTWGKQNEAYKKVATEATSGTRALSKVISGTDAQCLLFVSGLGSGTMLNVNELGKDTLKLVALDDGSFDDVKDPKGQQVYTFHDIPSGTYPNLQNFGAFGMGANVSTLAINAVLVANVSWIDANALAFDDFSAAAIRWSQQNKK